MLVNKPECKSNNAYNYDQYNPSENKPNPEGFSTAGNNQKHYYYCHKKEYKEEKKSSVCTYLVIPWV